MEEQKAGFWDFDKDEVPSKAKIKEQILSEDQCQLSSTSYLSKLQARKQHLTFLLSNTTNTARRTRNMLAWH
jgi:hypothetical protein